jgi:hypothetical protein
MIGSKTNNQNNSLQIKKMEIPQNMSGSNT